MFGDREDLSGSGRYTSIKSEGRAHAPPVLCDLKSENTLIKYPEIVNQKSDCISSQIAPILVVNDLSTADLCHSVKFEKLIYKPKSEIQKMYEPICSMEAKILTDIK